MSPRYRRVVVEVPGYSYTRSRLVSSYLRKVKGRSRRVRVNVYEPVTIHVHAYSYERIYRITAPRPKRKAAIRPKAAPPPRPYLISESQARAEQLEAIRLGYVPAPEPKRVPLEWQNVREFTEALEVRLSFEEGYEIDEREMEIYHSDPIEDWVHLPTLFVWPVKKLPTKLDLSKKYGAIGKTPFLRTRIWFLVQHDEDDELVQIWTRTMTHVLTDFEGCKRLKQELWEAVQEDVRHAPTTGRKKPGKRYGSDPNFTAQELIAWTSYLGTETLPHKKPPKIGGSGA